MEEIELLRNEIRILNELNQKIKMEMDFDEVIDNIIYSIRDRIQFDDCNISLIEEENDKKYLKTRNLKLSHKVKNRKFALKFYNKKWELDNKSIGSVVYNSKSELLYEDFDKIELIGQTKINIKKLGLKAFYCLPLKLENRVYGIMGLANYDAPMILTEFEKEIIKNRTYLIARAIENYQVYIKTKEQKELLEKKNKIISEDLKLAKKIQMNFIKNQLPELCDIDVHTVYIPMFDVGGDYYDFYLNKNEDHKELGVLITDASGHGVQAALITSMLKMSFDSIQLKSNISNPKKILECLNKNLYTKLAGNFVTAQYCFFDFKENKIKLSNAGHNSLILIRNGKITKFHPSGKVIGLFKNPKYSIQEFEFQKEDVFFFYTDGLTEAINEKYIDFEKQVDKLLLKNSKKTAKEINNIILKELKNYTKKEHYDDDIAIITIKIR